MVDAGPEATRPRPEETQRPPIVLGGRYRLVRQVGTGAGTSLLWLGEDQILARPVAIRILPEPLGGGGEGDSPILTGMITAAGQAGRAVSARLSAVYDAAAGRSRDGRRLAYVVREWCPGRALSSVLRDGPLSPAASALLVRSIADGLDVLQAAGLSHGRLHPGNVLLPEHTITEITARGLFRGGDEAAMRLPLEVKIADAVIAESLVLSGPRTAATRRFVRLHPDERVAVDTADTARLLYAMLTARWPRWEGPGELPSLCVDWDGLPAAPERGPRLVLPRQLSAGVPRQADTVVARVLDPPARPRESPVVEPLALSGAVEPLLRYPHPTSHGEADAAGPRGPEEDAAVVRQPRLRRPFAWALRLGVLAGLAVAGWVLGLVVGRVPTTPGAAKASGVHAPAPSASVSASPAGPQPIDLSGAGAVVAFDPEGDRQEDDAGVGKAVDGDPSTGWQTEIYQSGPTFSGTKAGVGLMVDLGNPTAVGSVQLALSGDGSTAVELRAAPEATAAPTDLTSFSDVVASGAGAAALTLTPGTPTTSRFWLVWLTSLPRANGSAGWQGEIDEMSFLPR